MPYPGLLYLPNEESYRAHFIEYYVRKSPIMTFDNIAVRFFERNFSHAFYAKSTRGAYEKDLFSMQRATRIDWIRHALESKTCELYRRTMPNKSLRRIALMLPERYSVVIQVDKNQQKANFITAYVVGDDESLRKMRGNPRW